MKSDNLLFDKAKSEAVQKYVNDTQINKLSKNHDAVCFDLDSKPEIEKKDENIFNNFYAECFFNYGNIDESFKSRSIQDGKNKKGIEFASQKIKKRPKPDINSTFKELKAKFKNSITKRRNLDTNTIVNNLSKEGEKGNMFKLYEHDNWHIEKFLQLRKLNITYINPMTEFRYNDYIFPQISELFAEENDHTQFPVYHEILKIKRVIKMERKLKTNELTFYFEDNDIRYSKFRQNQQKIEVGYFKKWLLSLGNKRALSFEQSIDANYKKLLDMKSKISQINPRFLQLLKLTDVNSISYNTKHYIEKLDKNTKNWIKNNFYSKRLSEINLDSGDQILKLMTFCENLCRAISVSKCQDCNSKILDFVDRIKMCNFISEWTNMLYVRNYESVTEWNMIGVSKPKFYSKDNIRLINENNTYLKASLGMYKELYVFQGKLHSKTYAVYFTEKV